MFGTQLGLALRRYCPPVLGLPAHAGPDEYLTVRAALGCDEVSRRFLRAAGLDALYVDTGFEPEPLTSPAEPGARWPDAADPEVVRLEQVAEDVAAGLAGDAGAAGGFAAAFRAALADRARNAAGLKSVAAYRVGLDLAPARPTGTEVAVAAAHWLDTPGRPGPGGWPTRCCTGSSSGAGPTWGCPSSSTSATATATSTCTGATRCC